MISNTIMIVDKYVTHASKISRVMKYTLLIEFFSTYVKRYLNEKQHFPIALVPICFDKL